MSTDPGTAGAARGRPSRWLARRTLRGRLIAGLLALLAVACAAVGVVTYVALRGSLLGQLDQQLSLASHQYSHCEETNAEHAGDGDREGGGGPGPGPPPQNCGEIPGQA